MLSLSFRALLTVALWVGPSLQALSLEYPRRSEVETLDSLARDVKNVESVREIKDVQRTLSQLAGFGRWKESADLFSETGVLEWGNQKVQGPKDIETWLKTDAGNMDGIKPGSLNLVLAETPIINLSDDGKTAKGRWNGLRFQGDGANKTKIQGGIYENEYVLDGGRWKISLLKYYAMYDGQYEGGWRNVGGPLPIIPYHFTAESTGIHIPPQMGAAPMTNVSSREVAYRISQMNNEDDVRNLQHAYGYYVDRRMWTDVVELFAVNATARIDGRGVFQGVSGIRQALETTMGPEGLTEGILNDHMILSTVVKVSPNLDEAVARSTGVAMLGDTNKREAFWEFGIYRNTFVREDGVWKIKSLDITPLVRANYTVGWGSGGMNPSSASISPPPFISIGARSSEPIPPPPTNKANTTTDLADLQRNLARASAYDGAENVGNAYGYYLDDLRCEALGTIHANQGHKLSPFAGWYLTPRRIADACIAAYGNRTNPMRSSISFHWRPQPVILVSADGRSATFRARLFQPSTSANSSGAFNGAIYHDQMVLEDGRWKLWDITIDEHYWTSSGWQRGWAYANKRPASSPDQPAPRLSSFPPDVTLVAVGERESTFRGGSGRYLEWPEIQRMWFAYRNPVSGRLPEFYWPGCVPCQAKTEWRLLANGYQEPATGPTHVAVNITAGEPIRPGKGVVVLVRGGPGEPVEGRVELRVGDAVVDSTTLRNGSGVFEKWAVAPGKYTMLVRFLGSDRLNPGQATVEATVVS